MATDWCFISTVPFDRNAGRPLWPASRALHPPHGTNRPTAQQWKHPNNWPSRAAGKNFGKMPKVQSTQSSACRTMSDKWERSSSYKCNQTPPPSLPDDTAGLPWTRAGWIIKISRSAASAKWKNILMTEKLYFGGSLHSIWGSQHVCCVRHNMPTTVSIISLLSLSLYDDGEGWGTASNSECRVDDGGGENDEHVVLMHFFRLPFWHRRWKGSAEDWKYHGQRERFARDLWWERERERNVGEMRQM